ncbi:MAG: hydantoinase/oxoprolinase family protein [Pseudomonadota bacterium]
MSYRLGVDVGGTFTDLLLVNEKSGQTWTAKVPSTPADQSIGVLNGIARVCERAGIDPTAIDHVMHGTTVATNTVLTGTGARCGLVTTQGYRQVLQIARSFVPGGLGGWVIYNKSLPMAPLACTIEAKERMSAKGDVVTPLDEAHLREQLRSLRSKNIEALTVSLINAYANDRHEKRIKEIAAEELPGLPVSLSSEVVPEMQEYERTVTTVANSYVRPKVQKYVHNLQTKLEQKTKNVKLHILRSDGGLASAKSSAEYPVNLLMSGPAGGVTGALWVAVQAVQKIADSLGKSIKDAALGIYDIVNENMVGALRLVSVEQGHDPRDYALIAFGGAGPLHANALSRLLGSWPSIIPPGPGVLCALGDATTAVRDESARTFIRKFSETSAKDVAKLLRSLADDAARALEREKVPRSDMRIGYQVDVRYHGQGLQLTVNVDVDDLEKRGLEAVSEPFDEEHKRLFTFALPLEHELVNVRAFVQGKSIQVQRPSIEKGGPDPKAAAVGKQKTYMDGKDYTAIVYDRAKLKAGNKVAGPAIVMEMDSTTVILPGHTGLVEKFGNILIYPDGHKALKGGGGAKAAARPARKPAKLAKAKPAARAKTVVKAVAKAKAKGGAKKGRR